MTAVALSTIPGPGSDLEDYVAGLFQASGYYVERNVRQRAETDVLELDTVATSYEGRLPQPILAEVKGGRWGFPDLFKVAGWMRYLGIGRGSLFVRASRADKDVGYVNRTVAPLGVSLVDLGDCSDPGSSLRRGGFGAVRDLLLVDVCRYSFRVERALLDETRRERKTSAHRGPAAVLEHHDLIHDHAFFIKDAGERLRRLYEAYRAHPRLSLEVAREIGGSSGGSAGEVLADALGRGASPVLEASLDVEHRARLGILKTAVDLACLAESGTAPPASLRRLPETFRAGLGRLRARPSFRRLALLWQVFLWGLGGFLLAGREAEELGWLSTQTGIPRAQVAAGLGAFDDLFPLPGSSWIASLGGIRVVKLVPASLRGIGALQRLRRAGAKDYHAITSDERTRRTLTDWHNALVRALR